MGTLGAKGDAERAWLYEAMPVASLSLWSATGGVICGVAMSWRTSFEGRACDAVLRHIEARTGMTRANLRRPEREGHAAPIELACELGGTTYGIEHTAVEAYGGQIENDVHFERQMSPIAQGLTAHVPANEHWEVIIAVNAMRAVQPRAIPKTQGAMTQAILAALPRAPVVPWGAVNAPTELGQAEGTPIRIRIRRFNLDGFDMGALQGAHITRSVGALEEPRAERMRKVCTTKFAKLKAWGDAGARTILVLESNDYIITNPQAVATAYLDVERDQPHRPHEVWFVWAMNELPGLPRYLSAVRIDDTEHAELWRRGPNQFEVDPAQLSDITAHAA